MAESISFRVKSWSEPGQLHVVTVGDECSCDCTGFALHKFCRHLDAVLVHGERFMVPEEDRPAAEAAMKLAGGSLSAPEGWQASWRRDYAWRGLHRSRPSINPRTSGKPLVCFTGRLLDQNGQHRQRDDWEAEAQANGWDTTDDPSPFTDVLVAADPMGSSSKIKKARASNTVIVSAGEWSEIMTDGVLPVC
ncbi:BRCT domain-containing protein [Altererythrobacter fulvus]|uniref:BRCT domain-containing protein n=1 Tax=Caenibius fulvus TaxID=2126012 RepID=UPI003016A766